MPKNYDRLAEYEDTGLSPEEIKELHTENAELERQNKGLREALNTTSSERENLLQAENARLTELVQVQRAMPKRLEHSGSGACVDDFSSYCPICGYYCPICGYTKEEGHAESCEMSRLRKGG